MGHIPTHLQHWDDWRDGRRQRRRHVVFSFMLGLAGGIAVFGGAVFRIWLH